MLESVLPYLIARRHPIGDHDELCLSGERVYAYYHADVPPDDGLSETDDPRCFQDWKDEPNGGFREDEPAEPDLDAIDGVGTNSDL